MNNEEYVIAQQVIAEGNTSLAVQALKESNEELQSTVDDLQEDIARLRNSNRTLRTVNKALRAQVEKFMGEVNDLTTHIFDIAEKEFVEEGGREEMKTLPADEPVLVDGEPVDDAGFPAVLDPIQEKIERAVSRQTEIFTRGWIDGVYQQMRKEGIFPEEFPLTPAEIYEAAKQSSGTQAA